MRQCPTGDRLEGNYADKEEQILRFNCSSVAAIAGLNPYSDVTELVMECLYQDLPGVLRADEKALGVEFLTKKQEAVEISSRLARDVQDTLDAAARSALSVPTVNAAAGVLENVSRALQKSVKAGQLTTEQASRVRQVYHKEVNTQFGTRQEGTAVKAYEAERGLQVYARNNRTLVWPFPSQGGDSGFTIEPPHALSQGWNLKRPSEKHFEKGVMNVLCRFASATTLRDVLNTVAGSNCPTVWENIQITGDIRVQVPVTGSLPLPPIRFPPHLTPSQRRWVHSAAQKSGLRSWSEGTPPYRTLCVGSSLSQSEEKEKAVEEVSVVEVCEPSEVECADRVGFVSARSMKKKVVGNKESTAEGKEKSQNENTYFSLVGRIDGIVSEPFPNPTENDPESWSLRRVVVEVKNRMRLRHKGGPPPLHDMVQLTLYCIMLRADAGDLVEAVLARKGEESEEPAPPKITISRVCLDDPLYRHRKNFGDLIVPRLYKFADLIYALRRDDSLRYRYLLASEAQAALIASFCPFMYFRTVLPRSPGPAGKPLSKATQAEEKEERGSCKERDCGEGDSNEGGSSDGEKALEPTATGASAVMSPQKRKITDYFTFTPPLAKKRQSSIASTALIVAPRALILTQKSET